MPALPPVTTRGVQDQYSIFRLPPGLTRERVRVRVHEFQRMAGIGVYPWLLHIDTCSVKGGRGGAGGGRVNTRMMV